MSKVKYSVAKTFPNGYTIDLEVSKERQTSIVAMILGFKGLFSLNVFCTLKLILMCEWNANQYTIDSFQLSLIFKIEQKCSLFWSNYFIDYKVRFRMNIFCSIYTLSLMHVKGLACTRRVRCWGCCLVHFIRSQLPERCFAVIGVFLLKRWLNQMTRRCLFTWTITGVDECTKFET